MTNGAGAGEKSDEGPDGGSDDDARAWRARLGWAFGLVAEDPADRAAALARLIEVQGEVRSARERDSEAYAEARRGSLPEALWCHYGTDIATWPGLPYALLFLEWEARHPREWTEHCKEWGTKQGLIRDLAAAGHGEAVRARLTDLVVTVVQRAYRCKDREYVRVARAVDGAELRRRLRIAAASDDPWARRHARYVLWILDRPGTPNSRRVWRTWLAEESDTGPEESDTGPGESGSGPAGPVRPPGAP
ncbi:hypothetical protein [Streptomyces laurentii]|uniref:hypothetical protein n=1 Tax=Streptomyces laurentii TaxID=39478 RepID=UPI00368C25E0